MRALKNVFLATRWVNSSFLRIFQIFIGIFQLKFVLSIWEYVNAKDILKKPFRPELRRLPSRKWQQWWAQWPRLWRNWRIFRACYLYRSRRDHLWQLEAEKSGRAAKCRRLLPRITLNVLRTGRCIDAVF